MRRGFIRSSSPGRRAPQTWQDSSTQASETVPCPTHPGLCPNHYPRHPAYRPPGRLTQGPRTPVHLPQYPRQRSALHPGSTTTSVTLAHTITWTRWFSRITWTCGCRSHLHPFQAPERLSPGEDLNPWRELEVCRTCSTIVGDEWIHMNVNVRGYLSRVPDPDEILEFLRWDGCTAPVGLLNGTGTHTASTKIPEICPGTTKRRSPLPYPAAWPLLLATLMLMRFYSSITMKLFIDLLLVVDTQTAF